MPPVDTPLTLGPIGALRVLALVCLLRNINANADSKKKRKKSTGHVHIPNGNGKVPNY